MIKRLTVLLIVLFVLLTPLSLSAQSTVTEIESLAVEIWPDYDDTAVLVLLTGTLPTDTTLPATLTIPLPENADLNAVAHFTDDNVLTDQGIDYSVDGNQLTFTTPNRTFRIEFYMPYSANGLEREFAYTWEGGTAVNNLTAVVQQPLAAAKMSTTPSASDTSPGSDGLTYHNFPPQTLAANEPFTISVAYTMNSDSLTVNLQSETAVNTQPSSTITSEPADTGIDLPILFAMLGFVLIMFAVIWQLLVRQKGSSKPRKPQKVRTAATTKAKYCHNCGIKLQPDDKFCRECGTAVKK